MFDPPKVLVVLATYNEIENLPALVDELLLCAPHVDLLVVDDHSPDGTGEWCQEKSRAEPRLQVLQRACKQGQGSAIVAGMRHAIAQDYDCVVTMDADFSHQPRFLAALVEGVVGPAEIQREIAQHRLTEAAPFDVMIGSRYVPQGAIEGWPLSRRWMSRAVNCYARALLRLPARDLSGGFRCYRVTRLTQLDLDALFSSGYSFHEEILWRLKRIGCRIGETPIVFVNRARGNSKINAREACTALRVILSLGIRDRFTRPAAPAKPLEPTPRG